jgi:hypothetical protein
LGEGHGQILLGAGKRPNPMIAAVPVDGPHESGPWREIHELGEKGLAGVHEHLLGKSPKSALSNSNPAETLVLRAETVQLTGQR